jgi:hypothetical protein
MLLLGAGEMDGETVGGVLVGEFLAGRGQELAADTERLLDVVGVHGPAVLGVPLVGEGPAAGAALALPQVVPDELVPVPGLPGQELAVRDAQVVGDCDF